MTRYRITLRGVDVELRGYVDGSANLRIIADAVDPMGLMVVASEADDDFNPFAISQPEYPPTVEMSREVIERAFQGKFTIDDVQEELAKIHFMQALVIRGERHLREMVEAENLRRELHHFETEQMLAQVKGIVEGWDTETNEATQGALVAAIKAVLP